MPVLRPRSDFQGSVRIWTLVLPALGHQQCNHHNTLALCWWVALTISWLGSNKGGWLHGTEQFPSLCYTEHTYLWLRGVFFLCGMALGLRVVTEALEGFSIHVYTVSLCQPLPACSLIRNVWEKKHGENWLMCVFVSILRLLNVHVLINNKHHKQL